MRRAPILALILLAGASSAFAADDVSARLSRYFEAWYSVCPNTQVSVSRVPEIKIPGYESWRVERRCDAKNRNEMSVTLVSTARDEVFVGEILHSDEPRTGPFSPEKDVPVIEGALREAFGVPLSVRADTSASGDLLPLTLSLEQAQNAVAKLPGFVSRDGATVMLGSFRPFGEDPRKLREKLLAAAPGVRVRKGPWYVTAFIDLQCERCRVRVPEVRDFVWTHGGAMEIRFLPLVKTHDWAFAAAESAAALAGVSPELYERYEQAVGQRASSMNRAAAREIAADVADAAGSRSAYDAELSTGRARERVLRDVELALSLGLFSTPAFFYGGAQLTGEAGGVEKYVEAQLSEAPAPRASASASGSQRH
jgi:protein-disulfide isomerase